MRISFVPGLRPISGPAATAILVVGLGCAASVSRAQDNSTQSAERGRRPDTQDTGREHDPADSAHEAPTLNGERTSASHPAPTSPRRNPHHHAALGVTLNEDAAGNLYIRRVLPGSPAEEAGLRQGDEILTVDSQRVNHTEELRRALARVSGDDATLGILRKGRYQTVSAELAVPDETFDAGNARAALGVLIERDGGDGAWVDSISANSPAAEAGVRPGDEIVALDGHPVASGDDLMRAISRKHPGDQVALDVKRNGRERTMDVTLARAQDIVWEGNESRSSRNEPSRPTREYRSAGRPTYDASGNYYRGNGYPVFSGGRSYGPSFWRADRKVTGY
ncbi:MAG TPA: PDZ domain-containing protein [Pirellulales bacterium]|nr:PDZ domain-containing protein [Pirellulales bacterium]